MAEYFCFEIRLSFDDVVDDLGPSWPQIWYAAQQWYGDYCDKDYQCLAENRLMKGEMIGVLRRSDEVSKVHAVQDGLYQGTGDAWTTLEYATGERISG